MKINSVQSVINSTIQSQQTSLKSENKEENDSSTRKIEYVLEGGVIKVYVIDGKSAPRCVKTILLSIATPEILAKVKNPSFLDMMRLQDINKNEQKEEKDLHSNGNNMLQKKVKEYEKFAATF
ncbi:hypothetical protein [Inediibacterium massiliense]|uniref:hypothetical protein n=1 Tax=Inediibacterium massiliense TaxID=1658111 RepID=UPI0006B66596|nr:hypothetical protein [Inediibacterium massiliense]